MSSAKPADNQPNAAPTASCCPSASPSWRASSARQRTSRGAGGSPGRSRSWPAGAVRRRGAASSPAGTRPGSGCSPALARRPDAIRPVGAVARSAAAAGAAARLPGAACGRAASGWPPRCWRWRPRCRSAASARSRQQHPGLDTEQLADTLIAGAARASAGVGAAVGAAAAVPFIPTVPVELGVETLALVAIELKLIAELHEVYGMPAPGSARSA